jgi:hypothetical protein
MAMIARSVEASMTKPRRSRPGISVCRGFGIFFISDTFKDYAWHFGKRRFLAGYLDNYCLINILGFFPKSNAIINPVN